MITSQSQTELSSVPPAGDFEPRRWLGVARGAVKPMVSGRRRSMTIKLLICAAAGPLLILGPLLRLMVPSSEEAVVNARLVVLRAPIGGVFEPEGDGAELGAALGKGVALAGIRDPRADRSRLDGLNGEIGGLMIERDTLNAKLRILGAHSAEQQQLTDSYRDGRLATLGARLRQMEAGVANAETVQREAGLRLQRDQALARDGDVSQAALDRTVRDAGTAQDNVSAARAAADETRIEQNAAQAGSYVSDGYNDQPVSEQRVEDLNLQQDELQISLQDTERKLALARSEQASEAAFYQQRTHAVLISPVAGRLWAARVAAGQEVRQGDVVYELLDCAAGLVSASVKDSVYEKLAVGEAVSFRGQGLGSLPGWIAALSGSAGDDASMALPVAATFKQPYHITLVVPGLSGCAVGRNGTVEFHPGWPRHG